MELLDSQPAFDLRLSCGCVLNVLEAFEIDKFVDFVASGKGVGIFVGLVLGDSSGEIVGYTGIELLKGAGKDVDVVGVGHWF